MKCPETSEAVGGNGKSNMQLYQEAIACMELIAANLKGDKDYSLMDQLYRQCTANIEELRDTNTNPYISNSLEDLLETLAYQQCTVSMQSQDRRRTVSEGYYKNRGRCRSGECERRASERWDGNGQEMKRHIEVEDMVLSHTSSDGPTLEEIAGLEDVKQVLREAVLMPLQYPHLFQGAAKAWKRLLLYGPPGTGKTALARALAREMQCPFYCVSPAHLLSSYVGESEKLIRELFRAARSCNGVLFFDEIDSLCRSRSSTEDEHSRRVKTELLRHLEGLCAEGGGEVFVLAATNCPWDLDAAFLRRFQRRIYVPLPHRASRQAILQQQTKGEIGDASDQGWAPLLDATQGYSGADLTHLAMAAAFIPIRELQTARFWKFADDNKIMPCSNDTLGAMQCTLSKLPSNQVAARPVELRDLLAGLKTTPRSVSPQLMLKYEQFDQTNL